MAVTIVGMTTAQTSGAVDISITPPVEATDGDTLLFCIAAHREPLAGFTMTPPFSIVQLAGYSPTAAGSAPKIYAIPYAGAISYTFTFSVATIYADVACVAIRGHRKTPLEFPESTRIDPVPVGRSGETQGGAAFGSTLYPFTISMGNVSTSTDNNLFFCFGKFTDDIAPVYTLPAEFTVIWSVENVSATEAHTSFIATRELPTAGDYVFSDGTLTNDPGYIFNWCILVPEEAEEPLGNQWTRVTDGASTIPAIVVDTDGPYVYQLHGTGTDNLYIQKIHRGTLDITDATISDVGPSNTHVVVVQDASSLFMIVAFPPLHGIVRVQKSDLTLMTTYTSSVTTPVGLIEIALGRMWNAGKVWAVNSRGSSGGNLISWDIETGSQVDNVVLDSLQEDSHSLAVLPSGDILVSGFRQPAGTTLNIVKVSSGLSPSLVTVFDGTQGEQPIFRRHGLLYDEADGNILVISQNDNTTEPAPVGYDHILKVNQAGTILYDVRRLAKISYVVNREQGVITTRGGARSLFVTERDWRGSVLSDGSIVELNPSDLSHRRTIRLPLGEFRAESVRRDPEGLIWALATPSPSLVPYRLYVLGHGGGHGRLDEKIWARGAFGHGFARGYA